MSARLDAVWLLAMSALLVACGPSSSGGGEHALPPTLREPGAGHAPGDAPSSGAGAGADAAGGPLAGAPGRRDLGDGRAGDPSTPADPEADEPGQTLLQVSAPVRLSTLVGPGAAGDAMPLYGTDLGISYEHDGQYSMLFGDTWKDALTVCSGVKPTNDDTLASLSAALIDGVLPVLDFVTDAVDQTARSLELMRGEDSLSMGFGQVPMAAFSDGRDAYVTFARLEPVRCGDSALPGGGSCPTEDGFVCLEHLGECQPAQTAYPLVCDVSSGLGCYPGQQCQQVSLCMDPSSSQYDGTLGGESSALAQETEIAVQRRGSPTTFDSVRVLSTSKFSNMTARTVRAWTGASAGNDYAPGHDMLLIWGRPGFVGEHGREAQLYLMTHTLPLSRGADGQLAFTPRYFAGLDTASGEPTWSSRESEAKPLSLDGKPGGNPHEQAQIVNQMSVSWVGAPIDKWVMLYGGDVSPFLIADPDNAYGTRAHGAIMLRYADHPWGPWSPPQTHLSPGSPAVEGDPYGPGGFVFHPDCVDTEERACAKSDPARPPDSVIPGCPISLAALDPGRFYGVNVIDPYTEPNAEGGLDFVWNVSTWNPYTVQLMRTSLTKVGQAPKQLELTDAAGLRRMGHWESLPELPASTGRYVQQTSRDRGTDDSSFPLSGKGNRDFNNFRCKSADAQIDADQITPFHFDLPECEEDYVQGVELARFEGAGHMVRMWIGMLSLMFGEADDEVLRLYIDDDPTPRVEVLLRDALDGSAGEIFAPPFGAGSPRRLAWYYPVAFDQKLIVALDRLGPSDSYFHHVDVVLDDAAPPAPVTQQRLLERDEAEAQLGALYRPAGEQPLLGPVEHVALGTLGTQRVARTGPATVQELRVHVAEAALSTLSTVQVSVRWDGSEEPAIELPLSALFASSLAPPERPSAALTSFVEGEARVLSLKLPMPFVSAAEWSFTHLGLGNVAFDVELRGEMRVPSAPFGHLFVQARQTLGPTTATHHVVAAAEGRGRLVGVCAMLEGHADPNGGLQFDPLNMLEGDVDATLDGEPALVGTGTEEYADDVFYFSDAPHGSPFVQAWGKVSDTAQSARGQVNMCRFHVLGTELDFHSSLDLRFELGGAANPQIVDRIRTVAFLYQ